MGVAVAVAEAGGVAVADGASVAVALDEVGVAVARGFDDESPQAAISMATAAIKNPRTTALSPAIRVLSPPLFPCTPSSERSERIEGRSGISGWRADRASAMSPMAARPLDTFAALA